MQSEPSGPLWQRWAFDASTMTPISFNLAKEDVLALACYYYATSPTVRRARLKMQAVVGLIFATSAILVLIGTGHAGASNVVGVLLLVCAGVSVLFCPSWYLHSLRKSGEKMLEEPSYRKAFGRYTLDFNEEGIASQSPTGEGKDSWEAVNSVTLTPEHLFIFLVGHQGFAIPRSQFPDSTIQELKAFADSHIRRTEPDAPPNSRPPPRLSPSPETQTPDSLRTPSPGGCG